MPEQDPNLNIGEVPYIPPLITTANLTRKDGSTVKIHIATVQPDLSGVIEPGEQVTGQLYMDIGAVATEEGLA